MTAHSTQAAITSYHDTAYEEYTWLQDPGIMPCLSSAYVREQPQIHICRI